MLCYVADPVMFLSHCLYELNHLSTNCADISQFSPKDKQIFNSLKVHFIAGVHIFRSLFSSHFYPFLNSHWGILQTVNHLLSHAISHGFLL